MAEVLAKPSIMSPGQFTGPQLARFYNDPHNLQVLKNSGQQSMNIQEMSARMVTVLLLWVLLVMLLLLLVLVLVVCYGYDWCCLVDVGGVVGDAPPPSDQVSFLSLAVSSGRAKTSWRFCLSMEGG